MEHLLISITIGTVMVGVLWIGVSNRRFLVPVSLFALLLFITPSLNFLMSSSLAWYTCWAVGAVGLCASYYLRIRAKQSLAVIDYFKISAVVLFSLYLIPAEELGLHYNFQEPIATP